MRSQFSFQSKESSVQFQLRTTEIHTLLALAMFAHRVIIIYCPNFRRNKPTLAKIKYQLWSDLRMSIVQEWLKRKRGHGAGKSFILGAAK